MTIPSTKVILAIVIAALAAVILAIWGFNSWRASSGRAAQGRVEANQTKAAQDSATDAVATVGAAGSNESASADLTRTNETEIRNAKGADAAVDPAVRDAGLVSVCRRASAKRDPKCVRYLNPSVVGGGR